MEISLSRMPSLAKEKIWIVEIALQTHVTKAELPRATEAYIKHSFSAHVFLHLSMHIKLIPTTPDHLTFLSSRKRQVSIITAGFQRATLLEVKSLTSVSRGRSTIHFATHGQGHREEETKIRFFFYNSSQIIT